MSANSLLQTDQTNRGIDIMAKIRKRAKNKSRKSAKANMAVAETAELESVEVASAVPRPAEPDGDDGESSHSDTRASSGDRKTNPGEFIPTQDTTSKRRRSVLPVAAIGASAGGLEPIEQFFDAMPTDTGCAFVIIQHLSPDFRSLMDELLARHSSMPIYRITDGMEIKPDSIYLNPPRSVMTISGNRLLVESIKDVETVYLPIDIFFESLAQDRGPDAIGLVLSGTGSDGTRGSQFIKMANGKVLVQDPVTTRFDGMPRSVLAEGFSTLVAAPDVLAQSVERLLRDESLTDLDTSERVPVVDDPLSDVFSMLKHSHGTDFLQYKEATIYRRIERRAQICGLTEISDYRDILSTDVNELQELYADLLIEVTEFFRNKPAFELLQKEVIETLTKNLNDGDSLRVWVPGCASGEEAYSIAILLQEQARIQGIILHLKIMATDIHIRSMNQASSGIYEESALRNLPKELIDRYFDCADGQVQIKPNLRNMVFFSTHDVTRDPPFTRIDLISCRNLLIYLKEKAQERVMNLLHFSLRKYGFLFLGPSEHIGAIAHEFETVSEKWRIYKKRRDVKLLEPGSIFQRNDIVYGAALGATNTHSTMKSQNGYSDDTIPFKRAHRAALETIVSQYAPPGFLLTEDGVVVHIFGNAGEMIPMQSGSFSKRIVDLIRPELKVIITTALDHSRLKDFSGFRRASYVREDDVTATTYEVSLVPMELPGETLRFQLLSIEQVRTLENKDGAKIEVTDAEFAEIDSSQVLQQRISLLEHNLQTSEESLQSTIEELETSNEELQSTNEELMSTNEELQSTNEELHSVNEELYTVSAEYQRKNEELVERETDIDVLLQSSKIGTIHLDEKLRLQRYTNNARSVFNILPQDVGRPIEHITIRSDEQDIPSLIENSNQFRQSYETQVAVDDQYYLLRIMPYRSEVEEPSGVLITVIDITDLEQVRGKLAELNVQYKDLIENTGSFFVRWDARTNKILYCNEAYARRWKVSVDSLIGKSMNDIPDAAARIEFKDLHDKFEPNEAKAEVYTGLDTDGRIRYSRVFTRSVSKDGITIDEFQANGHDVTEEHHYRIALDKLVAVFSDEYLDSERKIERLLDVGLDYFYLDTALVSMIVGDKYEIRFARSNKSIQLKPGSTMALNDTFCGQFVEKSSSMVLDDVSNSKFNRLPCHKITGIESFVGASIQTAHGSYGTVSFSSQKARGEPYSKQDENYAMVIAGWIGFLLGNEQQIDFMSNQNDYYQSLFRSVPSMMFFSDTDGLIVSASDRLCVKLGFEPEKLLGKNCHDTFNVDDQDGLKMALSTGSADHHPITFMLDDGSTLEVELNCSIKTVGSLQGIRMVVLSDVSERNKVSRNLEEQNRRLATANENLNQFAFIASHDLQEPLRKIQQFSSFLEEDLKDQLDTDTNYHLNVIVDASDRMSTLIHDLLKFSGATQDQPEIETVSLNTLVKEVVDGLEIPVTETKAVIDVGDLPTVQGDKSMLRQLFVNLIGNCIKYRSTERSPIIVVAATDSQLKEGVSIADNGIGFEMEFARKIFEPFNRLHRNKDYKGNGIGLAICSTVCDKHGWKLTATSEVDVGSVFNIEFHKKQKDASSTKKTSTINGG